MKLLPFQLISKEFDRNESIEVYFKENAYNFSVDYAVIELDTE